MNANIIEKANQICDRAEEAYIGVIDEAGYPSVSTVSRIHSDGIFTSYFATGTQVNKSKRILKNDKASICYRKEGDNVTLVGKAEILTDKETRHSLWQDWFIDHFPLGKDDPGYCIIRFTAERVSLWIGCEEAEFTIQDALTVSSCCGLYCTTCSFKESCGCGGCMETKGNPFHGECPIATCCFQKGFSHCGQCPQLPCEQLHHYSCGDLEHGDKPAGARLNVLRRWRK